MGDNFISLSKFTWEYVLLLTPHFTFSSFYPKQQLKPKLVELCHQ